MKRMPLVILGMVVSNIQGQNLVMNPGFEEYEYCPPIVNEDVFPSKNWRSPNKGTTDYFHSCSRLSDSSVPCSTTGCYPPHSGNAYIGLGILFAETGCAEHIQGRLTMALEAGKKYKVSFWARLAHHYSDYATYNLGLHFSDHNMLQGKYWERTDSYIAKMTPKLHAHVENTNGCFLTDTTWVEISGVYTAKGGEKFITIGAFWDSTPKIVKAWDRSKKIDETGGHPQYFGKAVKKHMYVKNRHMKAQYKNHSEKGGQSFAYYFLDDVSVELIEN